MATSAVNTAVAKAVSSVTSVVETIGKDLVTVVGIVGSVLAAAGGIVPADVALYVTTGLLVFRTLGEDLEKTT